MRDYDTTISPLSDSQEKQLVRIIVWLVGIRYKNKSMG